MSPPEESPHYSLHSPPAGPAYINMRAVEFAQQQPPDMPASEVVQRARDAGLELELAQVYLIRERDRQRAEKSQKDASAAAAASIDEPEQEEDTDEDEDEGEDEEPEANSEQEHAVTQDENAAPRRRGRKPGGIDTKAGFVRSLPADLPIPEVIEQGKARGFELNEAYIRVIRSKLSASTSEAPRKTRKRRARSSPEASPPSTPEPGPPASAPATPPAQVAPAAPAPPLFDDLLSQDSQEIELEFARLVARIGLLRAEQILDRFKNRLSALLQSPTQPSA